MSQKMEETTYNEKRNKGTEREASEREGDAK